MIKLENCPNCGSTNLKLRLNCTDHTVSRETFGIFICDDCELMFTNPRPLDENLNSYYKSEKYISHTNSNRGLFNKAYQFVRKITIKNKVKLLGKKKGKVLEIGSGTGELLNALKKCGWHCDGVEPDKDARELAEKNHNLKLHDSINKIKIGKDKYDRIMLWHVLEHISDINKTLSTIYECLNKDGLCIIAVPNYKSYDAKIYRNFWAAYDVPRHLFHFNKKSLISMMNKHSFEIEKIIPMKFDSFYVSLLSERIKNGKDNYLKGFFNGLISNINGWFSNEYSSQIYVFRLKNLK